MTGGGGSVIGGSNLTFLAKEGALVVILRIDLEAGKRFAAKQKVAETNRDCCGYRMFR